MTSRDRAADPDRGPDGPPPLAPGELLAPGYRVVAHLRRGADLDVYDLWSAERACRCVGKTPRPDLDRATTARRLLREGRLLARLSHPHIVRAYDTLTAPRPLVILETLPGETLAHLIDRQRHRLPIADVAYLGLHLCSAMHYLHRHRVLHLDLKPSNVVASNGLAKVLDLSIARPPGRTRGGLGTPGYMAPEQNRGGLLGPHTDVWGIGAVLYAAATGRAPCDPDDPRSDVRPDPIGRHRRVPAAFAAAVDGCLAPEPAQRPTVGDLTEMLIGLIEERPSG